MNNKTKLAGIITIVLWASAYVGIRIGLHDYSPAGLALLRYLIASTCMVVIYFYQPKHHHMLWRDRIALMLIGVIGIGIYNVSLNYGELAISSGVASFIVGQAPLLTLLFAMVFLGERLNLVRVLGFVVSILGVGCMVMGQDHAFVLNMSVIYILVATFAGSFFVIAQKPFLKKYSAIDATAYIIWGGTLFLAFFARDLQHDLQHASMMTTLTVIYLGIFPAALGYLGWSYVLNAVPASHAASALYFIPFVATLMGWLMLNEVPMLISLLGGVFAVFGVLLINRSYKTTSIVIPRYARDDSREY